MNFWVQFALSTAVALFGQFVKNPESARKYRSAVENIYHNTEYLLVALGSDAPQQPVVQEPVEPHAEIPV